MNCLIRIILGFMLSFTISIVNATPAWNQWVQQVRTEAINQGINSNLFDEVFRSIPEPNRRVLHFDKTQPERRITFLEYRKTRIDPYRITLGVREYKKNKALIEKIGQEFGVNPCFIMAIWGIESSYGRYMGDFPVIKSLATLAYDNRRSEFFRRELFLALHILNEGHVNNVDFKGEWAGASGHPQFLPSSWHKYAVDYDGDSKKDIWRNHGDAFASVANYLKQNGWQTGQPWSLQVKLPARFSEDLLGYKVEKPMSEWIKLGVQPDYGFVFPQGNLSASIIKPYGSPAFMIFKNFRILLKYNNSAFYAGSVGYLADEICKKAQRSSVFANTSH